MKKLSMDELKRVSVNEFKEQKKIPIVIVLDNIRSLNNVGSVFRTSDAFSVTAVYLCGITGTPPNKEIHKTALGATDSVNWKYFEDTIDALKLLKNERYKIIAIEQVDNCTSLSNFNPDNDVKIAFVFGNEIQGVSESALSFVDEAIEIPQFGTKHSLNISVSVGIVIWHYILSIKKGCL